MSFAPVLKLVAGPGITLDPVNGQGIVNIEVTGGAPPSPNAFYVVTKATDAPVNAVNLGALTSGVLTQSVTAGVATISATTLTGPGIVTASAGGALAVDTTAKVVLTTADANFPAGINLGALTSGVQRWFALSSIRRYHWRWWTSDTN